MGGLLTTVPVLPAPVLPLPGNKELRRRAAHAFSHGSLFYALSAQLPGAGLYARANVAAATVCYGTNVLLLDPSGCQGDTAIHCRGLDA